VGRSVGNYGILIDLHRIRYLQVALLCGKSYAGLWDSRVLICPKSAPIAVSKTDNIKIITPEANQFADAWDIDYRKYHDLFVPENKKAVIAVSLGV